MRGSANTGGRRAACLELVEWSTLMLGRRQRVSLQFAALALIFFLLASCTTPKDVQHHVIISVKEQKLALLDRQKNWRQRASGHSLQRPPPHWRDCFAQCSGARSNRYPHPLVARPGSAKRECVWALYLYSWYTGRPEPRSAGQLRLRADEVRRRD